MEYQPRATQTQATADEYFDTDVTQDKMPIREFPCSDVQFVPRRINDATNLTPAAQDSGMKRFTRRRALANLWPSCGPGAPRRIPERSPDGGVRLHTVIRGSRPGLRAARRVADRQIERGRLLHQRELDHPNEFRPQHFSRRVSPSEVLTYAQLYPPLAPGELIAGARDARFRAAWDMASAQDFRPVQAKAA
jgi:hypothetical protein